MSKRRTRREKIASKEKRFGKTIKRRVKQEVRGSGYLQADLTKTLWLTMLALGVEVALYYLLR